MNLYSALCKFPFILFSFKIMTLILIVALWTVIVTPQAWSEEPAPTGPVTGTSEGGNTSSAAMGAAAGLSTLLYLPLKAAFAIGGGIVGGLAYVFSGGNEHAAKSIWTTSLYGTYIITPEHLRGDKPIRFLGVADASDAPPPTSSPATEPVR